MSSPLVHLQYVCKILGTLAGDSNDHHCETLCMQSRFVTISTRTRCSRFPVDPDHGQVDQESQPNRFDGTGHNGQSTDSKITQNMVGRVMMPSSSPVRTDNPLQTAHHAF
jgi:hypothetical protein